MPDSDSANFEKLKELLGGLSDEAGKQKDLKKKLFRTVFSADDINRCAETVIDVALGSVARLMWQSTEDGHPSQAAAFEAMSEMRRHWRRASQTHTSLAPPPLAVFSELANPKQVNE